MKPLNKKAYGSIGHLPNSRLGSGDHCVNDGMAKICTIKSRKDDNIIVQEKLDGSCTAVAMINDEIIPLIRAGYRAETSPYEMHKLFAKWVKTNEIKFRKILNEGERIIGEWLAQAHSTIYDLKDLEPWAAFDIMHGDKRLIYNEFNDRIKNVFLQPSLLHIGSPITVDQAMKIHELKHWPCDELEGIIYRVERRNKVEFLAKWVRPNKIDGKYLKGPEIWNWGPNSIM